jgi:hypothetical protein
LIRRSPDSREGDFNDKHQVARRCPPRVAGLAALADAARKIAKDKNLPLIDLRAAFIAYWKKNNPDSKPNGVLTYDATTGMKRATSTSPSKCSRSSSRHQTRSRFETDWMALKKLANFRLDCPVGSGTPTAIWCLAFRAPVPSPGGRVDPKKLFQPR